MQPAPPEALTCPNCGSVLEKTPSGELGCMSCLLRAGIGSEEKTVHDSNSGASESGVRFGVYEIDCHADGSLCELGRGAMGVTYRATDTSLHRKVALKIIKTDIAERSADAGERFMREARAAAALRHENIATVYQFGMRLETGQYFYAMELIEGETLDERVRRVGPLDARSAIEIARQVASALAAAEEHGLVHRDLKPANLMLVSPSDKTGSNRKLLVKIIDFGLAKAIHGQIDPKSLTHNRFVGTPAFASPEQFEHSALDVRSDIYSLGETLWFALTGKTPFGGRSIEEIHRAQKSDVLPVEQLKAAHVPSRLRSLVESMLAFEPASRPGTSELAAQLQRCSPEVRSVRRTRFSLAATSLMILGMSAAIIFLWLRTQNSIPNLRAPEKSIAVLPFENLSADPENAFFTDGVQDEILNNLAKIADLKVISRTSVMQYKSGVKRNVREIANALGVAHVVEGSVQRAANRVRVSAQLIDARTDTHLWVERYDRPLGDVFSIQSEIAKAIAGQLQAKLSPVEKAAIEQPPTTNLVAYDRYLRAKKLFEDVYTGRLFENVRQTIRLLDETVALDPTFLLAYCQLARAHAYLYFLGVDHTPARVALAKEARDAALRLDPNRPEAHLAAAWVAYHCYLDYETALTEVAIARRGLPNDAAVFQITPFIARRQGHWEQSIKNLERAVDLDPRNVFLLQSVAQNYQFMRRFFEMATVLDRALTITPRDPTFRVSRAQVDLESRADTQPMQNVIQSILTEDPNAVGVIAEQWLDLALCRRNATATASALASLSPEGMQRLNISMPRSFCEGLAARAGNDATGAEAAFIAARVEMEKIVREQPDYAQALCVLGIIDAALGRKEDALRESRRAVELLPVTKDAYTGAAVLTNLAITYAWAGEKDLAIKQLEELVRIPSPISYGQLRLHPYWDPLRGDPRFEKLVEEAKLPVALSESEPGSDSSRNFAPVPKKSIAVLPFENRSRDPDNAYFADGVQDEILTRLSKIADLKVISRTSTQRYKSAPENLPEIAQQLGVAHVLEGSVQKSGDTVRVNVQLIKAANDSHVWADTFDRKLVDIFSVESEVAKAIADQLQARLTVREEQAIADKPTNNPAAYDAYLRGLALARGPSYATQSGSLAAAKAFDQAVKLAPDFALAWAELARANAYLYVSEMDTSPARRDQSAHALEMARRLRSDADETLLAQAYYEYWVVRDYDGAKAKFTQLRQRLPSNADIPMALALIARRQGLWNESLTQFEEASQLNPLDVFLLNEWARTATAMRQFPVALKLFDRALSISPNNLTVLGCKTLVYQITGDLESAGKLLIGLVDDSANDLLGPEKARQLLLQRRYADLVKLTQDRLIKADRSPDIYNTSMRVDLGEAQQHAGDIAGAEGNFLQALAELKSFEESRPDSFFAPFLESHVFMGLGRNQEAVQQAERAVALLPSSRDALTGPCLEANLAIVLAHVGENDRAIAALERLLKVPALWEPPLTPALLRLDPMFDPLRNDPRFQKLCEEKQP